MAKIVPVILSGGSGTRLWPLSRPARPKQLHALTAGATMLQVTAGRVLDGARYEAPIVVASERHADEIEAQLASAGAAPQKILLEPIGRNTAAAIALAALEADPAALLLVMPSDHVIGRPDAFGAAIERAVPHADEGHLMTFGIAPEAPETGYGYIKQGEPLGAGVFSVDRFVEKPDRATATRYLAEGGYHWNGGIFLFRAGEVIDGLERHAPDIVADVRRSLESARRAGVRVYADPQAFAAVRSQSIDHALMEVHDQVAVVPVQMEWSDVGSWDALYEVGDKDGDGNVVTGEALATGSSNCLFHSSGPLLVASGVDNLIVVATGDAVLILPRGEGQRVKDLVDQLKARDQPAAGG